ncbi:MAG: bifunctional DNA-binding transcriptional regulator/O6-methylguanine-DNA methyltransferase Ada [Moraxellaceae bacterium]|nr:bifunctional DNA-binding transcriptional regulator/O6-methylguanine-DNA methyltransferase Ada [Moraxellaceae bacterium]
MRDDASDTGNDMQADTTRRLAARHASAVAHACRQIEAREPAPSLAQLAEEAGMSPWHFQRVFKRETGLSPRDYAAAQRAGRLRSALREQASVTDAIIEAGYGSGSRVYEQRDALLGMTPGAYRDGGVGAVIRFAIGECSLGAILVAQSERGICAILLGDDAEALAHDLQDRFPKAELVAGDDGFEALVAEVVGLVETPARGLNLPLDIRGTAFQQRVWLALRDIPPGSTASYADIAARIGSPKAVRAVAGACAANALAVAIPCHRVVRTDGALSGYRWGVERKRALLAREAAEAATSSSSA